MNKQTTLCYIEKNGAYLMLHRVKKVNDENHDKWVGIGGKIEDGESPFDCVRREVLEEVGLSLGKIRYCGIITFVSDIYGTEYMHLFHSEDFDGDMRSDCDEGIPSWVKKSEVYSLPIWEGDKIFFRLMETESRFFSLKLVYKGDKLVEHITEFA